MLAEKINKQLLQEIIKELQPDFVLLFGSFAKGTNHEHSDIDLAYFSDGQLSNYERFIMASNLSCIAEREVDFIDIKKIDTIFTMQIFSEGTPIYIADENTFISQRIRAYSMYATLNEQRAPVIKTIKESGRVFKYE